MSYDKITTNLMSLAFDRGASVHVPTIKDTVRYIKELHAGQMDQGFQPYYTHLLRVAKNLGILDPSVSEDTLRAALMHDVIEDCGLTKADITAKGYSSDTADIIQVVSRPENDNRPYSAFIQDIIDTDDRHAMLVKLADVIDNNNNGRLDLLRLTDPQTADRLSKKYSQAMNMLADALGIERELCNKMTQRDIGMDEDFSGEKYYIFDKKPIKTIWEDGIISEAYQLNGAQGLVRNDALAYYVEKELSNKDEISREDFIRKIDETSINLG